MDDSVSRNALRTVESLLSSYSGLSATELLKPMAAHFRHQVLPASLGMPPSDKAAMHEHAKSMFAIFNEFHMVPQSISITHGGDVVTSSKSQRTDSTSNDQNILAVAHCRMEGQLKAGAGEWVNECVMIIQLSGDGEEIVDIKEFVDSAKAMEMWRKHNPKGFNLNMRGTIGGMASMSFTLEFAAVLLVSIILVLWLKYTR